MTPISPQVAPMELNHDELPTAGAIAADENASAALHEEYGSHLPNLLEAEPVPIVAPAPVPGAAISPVAMSSAAAVVTQAPPAKTSLGYFVSAIGLIFVAIGGVGALTYRSFAINQQAQSDKAALQGQVSGLQLQLQDAKELSLHNQALASSPPVVAPTLSIKEWGVSLPIPPATTDLTYAVLTKKPDQAILSSTSLTKLDANCAASAASVQTPLGSLSRVRSGATLPAGASKLGAAGGYDYGYIAASSSCTVKPAAITLAAQQFEAVKKAITSIK